MKKFQEVLMKDLGWKILSVAIAVVMWFMVINLNQPVDTRTYTKTITLENMDTLTSRGLTVENAEELLSKKVSVKIKAQRTSLDRLSQASADWMTVTVDLSALNYAVDGDTVSLPVNVAMQGVYTGYNIVSRNPATVDVYIEKTATKEFPIDIAVSGELSEDTVYAEPALSNETTRVTGAASAVARVHSVRAIVNAQDIQDGAALRAALTAYDADGVPVKGVTTNVSEITISYSSVQWSTIPIQVNIIGVPAEGYALGETVCTPPTLEVTGRTEAIEAFPYLQLPDIDISGSSENVTRSFVIEQYLPEGISVRDFGSRNIGITVEVNEVHSLEVEIPAENLTLVGAEEGLEYTLAERTAVTLQGNEILLQNLDVAGILGTVDVSGLVVGTQNTLAVLHLPDGVTTEPVFVEVTVVEKEELPEDVQ